MPTSLIPPDKSLFFCFGLPKSGTTFLQRMLDTHPEVSCPSEHQFDYLRNGFSSLFNNYNNALKLIDKRTGGQNATTIDSKVMSLIYRSTVELIIKGAANGKPIFGANDNAILNQLDFYDALFNSPKMLAIFRNPVDTGLSAWHHNLRLAEEEHPKHKELNMQFGGFDGWMRQCAKWFNEAVTSFKTFSRNQKNTMLVRYEDLTVDTSTHLKHVFSFLGASTDYDVIYDIVAKTTFEAMKSRSTQPGFFRSGSSSFGAGKIDASLREEIAKIAGQGLDYLGYDIISSRLLNVGKLD